MRRIILFLLPLVPFASVCQNVGIGTQNPLTTLHLRATADTTQLLIDGGTAQGNRPLLRFRKANGAELVQLRSDNEANLFLGYNAGQKNVYTSTGGWGNTALGGHALQFNVSGSNNTAIGVQTLQSNIGAENTAVGAGALLFNFNGVSNTAVGSKAMVWNNAGIHNTALGYEALYKNQSGDDNTAIGSGALHDNIADHNIALGTSALYRNTTGTENIAIGSLTLQFSIAASGNTAVGNHAMLRNTSGFENTALGAQALGYNTTGYDNVAIGNLALSNNQTGIGNIGLGYGAGTSQFGQYHNTISIGNGNYPNAANNQAFLGNLNIAWNGGNVGWSTFSDSRIKRAIVEDVHGLDFILRLRPVTYFRTTTAALELTGNVDSLEYEGKNEIETIRFSGFLAQEVEAAAKAVGYDFQGVQAPKSSHQLYSLSYETFVVPLVKATQEQQVQIAKLDQENRLLKVELAAMEARLEKLEKVIISKE